MGQLGAACCHQAKLKLYSTGLYTELRRAGAAPLFASLLGRVDWDSAGPVRAERLGVQQHRLAHQLLLRGPVPPQHALQRRALLLHGEQVLRGLVPPQLALQRRALLLRGAAGRSRAGCQRSARAGGGAGWAGADTLTMSICPRL